MDRFPNSCHRSDGHHEETHDHSDGARLLSVERNLNQKSVYSMLENIEDNQSKKWNFDFINEKPLDGDGEWMWFESTHPSTEEEFDVEVTEGVVQVVPENPKSKNKSESDKNNVIVNEENNLER